MATKLLLLGMEQPMRLNSMNTRKETEIGRKREGKEVEKDSCLFTWHIKACTKIKKNKIKTNHALQFPIFISGELRI